MYIAGRPNRSILSPNRVADLNKDAGEKMPNMCDQWANSLGDPWKTVPYLLFCDRLSGRMLNGSGSFRSVETESFNLNLGALSG
jgi:hypothetical protein